MSERLFDVSERAINLREERQQIRARAFVAQLIRTPSISTRAVRARSGSSIHDQYSTRASNGWSSRRRSAARNWTANARSAVAVADVLPSRPSAKSCGTSACAAKASSPPSSANATAASACCAASTTPSNSQRRDDATPSWAMARISRSPSASSMTLRKSSSASSGSSYVRMRASTLSALCTHATRRQCANHYPQLRLWRPCVARLKMKKSSIDGSSTSGFCPIRFGVSSRGTIEEQRGGAKRTSIARVMRRALQH